MYDLKERKTQSRVKHEILEQYLGKWTSIITSGLKNSYKQFPGMAAQSRSRFVYIDYFAFSGAYKENNKIVYGSPVLGIQALDKLKSSFAAITGGLTPSMTTILFEEDPTTYKNLIGTLESQSYGHRIRDAAALNKLTDDDIIVIKGDSSQYVDSILGLLKGKNPPYSFHFIDPYGTKSVERKNIEKIVSTAKADCIINMMLNPILIRLGIAAKSELVPAEQAHAGYFDEFFGSDIWRDIGNKVKARTINKKQAEMYLATLFLQILNGADENLWVKHIPLKFQDKDEILYYLFLTTHNETGAFWMNRLLDDASIKEYDYRSEKRKMKTETVQMQLDFLSQIPDQKRPTEPEPDIDELAKIIYTACRARKTMLYIEILREMVKSSYYFEDITAALKILRQEKRASFDGAPSALKNQSEITFL
ncbi:three-Cys-motif partner protein TcmP [Candidatus Parcubacteria bacterium]|nr:three-Cys-motif partner protein TcmP [Candidatus Parcubacteria bacterium]